MYDSILENKWHVEVEFTEDEVHTHASARGRCHGDDDRGRLPQSQG